VAHTQFTTIRDADATNIIDVEKMLWHGTEGRLKLLGFRWLGLYQNRTAQTLQSRARETVTFNLISIVPVCCLQSQTLFVLHREQCSRRSSMNVISVVEDRGSICVREEV